MDFFFLRKLTNPSGSTRTHDFSLRSEEMIFLPFERQKQYRKCTFSTDMPTDTSNMTIIMKRETPVRARPESHQGPVSWRPTTVKWRQFSQSNRHSTIGIRQTEYHEALPSSANDEVRCDCTFVDDRNASWYSVCRVPMVERRLDCEDCRHLTVVGLHDTGPRTSVFLARTHAVSGGPGFDFRFPSAFFQVELNQRHKT